MRRLLPVSRSSPDALLVTGCGVPDVLAVRASLTEMRVWYVAYGSNLQYSRFRCYLAGGCPPGAARTYVGSRDGADPAATRGVQIPGSILFGGESSVWTGGIAFYEPADDGLVAARAYLVTFEQFSDVVAQEVRRPPGTDLGLDPLETGPQQVSGAGHYETVTYVGEMTGRPMLTFTSLTSMPPAAPAPAYVRCLAGGLREAFGWSPERVADYLAVAPGAAGHWSTEQLRAIAGAR